MSLEGDEKMKNKIFFLACVLCLSIISLCVTCYAEDVVLGNITYSYSNSSKTYGVYKCDKSATEVEILNEIDGVAVDHIIYGAFEDCAQLKKVILPENIARIGDKAFKNCVSLTDINIPEKLTWISSGTFYGCSSLNEIELPDGVTSIEYEAFKDCTNLKRINIPDGVKEIENDTFNNCTSLLEIKIPEGTEYIGSDVFYNCKSLTEITIPDNVRYIGWSCFEGCTGLKSVTLGTGLESTGDLAFMGCSNIESVYIKDIASYLNCNYSSSGAHPLTYGAKLYINGEEPENVVIPEGVTQIPKNSFYNCSGLISVYVPKTVENIEIGAFYNCDNLESITVDEENSCYSSIDGHLFDKDGKTLIFCVKGKKYSTYKIPDGVVTVGQNAAANWKTLKRIIIPNSVEKICSSAFFYCNNLEVLVIGNGLKQMESGVTQGTILNTVYYNGTEDEWKAIDIKTDVNGEPITFSKNRIFSYDKEVIPEISEDGKTFILHPFNMEKGENVILGLYNNKKMAEVFAESNKGVSMEFNPIKTYTDAKLMVWENFSGNIPLCDVEILK